MRPLNILAAEIAAQKIDENTLAGKKGLFEIQNLHATGLRYCFSPYRLQANKHWLEAASKVGNKHISEIPHECIKTDSPIFNHYKNKKGYISWNTQGCNFRLNANDELTITQIDYRFKPSFYLVGAKKVKIVSGNFRVLHIVGGDVEFVKGSTVASLHIQSLSLLNKQNLNAIESDISVIRGANAGKMLVAKKCELHAINFDNRNADIHAGGALNVDIHDLKNQGGNLSGLTGTTLTIHNTYDCDDASEIGVADSNTQLCFVKPQDQTKLGVVQGAIVSLNNPGNFSGTGIIVASKEVVLRGAELSLPQIDIQSPILILDTACFQLKDQPHVDRTTLKAKSGRNITFSHVYRTTGSFEIQEEVGASAYIVEFQTVLQANKGFRALCYNAKLWTNNADPNTLAEFIIQDGDVNIIAREVDFSRSCVEALNAYISSPNPIEIGDLIEHPRKKVISTFYSHADVTGSHNLGSHIEPISYECIGKNSKVYNGRHLLVMPFITRNYSTWKIKDFTIIDGVLNLYGKLQTKNLILRSPAPSIIEAGFLNVLGDFTLYGDLQLRRVKSDFRFMYAKRWDSKYSFCNSDAAVLDVHGKTSGNGTLVIHGCDFNPSGLVTGVHLDPSSFICSMRQDVIDGTAEEKAAIIDAKWHSAILDRNGGFMVRQSPIPITAAKQNFDPQGYMPDGMGFLIATNNFVNSVKEFKANIGSTSTMVLSANNVNFAADVTAPMALILTSGAVTLFKSAATKNSFHPSNLPNPNRNLAQTAFNPYEVKVEDDLLAQIAANLAKPSLNLYYKIHERFGFDKKISDKFYMSIMDHIVLINRGGTLTKPGTKTVIMDLSLEKLLETAREECRLTINRPFMYEGQDLDAAFLRQAHINTTNFIRENNLDGHNFIKILANARLNSQTAPKKPMIYYTCLIDDDGLEILFPSIYVPVELIMQVHARANPGNLLLANTAFIVAKSFTPQEMLALAGDKAVLRDKLTNFFGNNSTTTKLIHDQAVEAKQQKATDLQQALIALQTSQALVPNAKPTPKVEQITVHGNVVADTFAVFNDTGVVIHADVQVRNAFIMSLMENVVIAAIKKRYGNTSNFTDKIAEQVRLYCTENLHVISGDNVIFVGAQTETGMATHVRALAKIIDIEVELVQQSTHHFRSKRYSITTTDVSVTNVVSKHKSEVKIDMEAGTGITAGAPEYEAPQEVKLKVADGIVELDEVHDVRHRVVDESRSKSSWSGKRTSSSRHESYSSISKGATIKTGLFTLEASAATLRNVSSIAALNVLSCPNGQFSILLGTNYFSSSKVESKRSLVWQKQSTEQIERRTYTESQFPGAIQFDSKRLNLEQVRGKTLGFLAQIQQEPDSQIVYTTVNEYHHYHSNKIQGPGAGLIGLVALATGIATAGTASGWAVKLGFTKATLAHTVVTAGFSSLCVQASVQLMLHNGNPLAVIESLAKIDTVKQVGVAMLTAGIMDKLCDAFDIPVKDRATFEDHVKYNVARAAVNATINMSVYDQNINQAILGAVIESSFSIVTASMVSNKQLSQNGKIALDTIAAAAQGEITGKGAVFGALEGFMAATLPGLLADKPGVDGVGYNAGDGKKEADEIEEKDEDDVAEVIDMVYEKKKTLQPYREYVTKKGKTTIYSPPASTPDSLDYSPSFRSEVAKFYGSDLVAKAEAQGKNLSDMFAASYVGSPAVREQLVELEVIREKKLEFRRECQEIYNQKLEWLVERGVRPSKHEFMLRHETRNLHRANQALAKVEQDIYDTIRTDGYKPNAAAKAWIGLGRFGRTLEELGNNARYYGGEKLKIYSAGTYDGYRARMNRDEAFYRGTYVGQSTVANCVELGAEAAVSFAAFEMGVGPCLLWSSRVASQVATRASYFGATGVVNTASDWSFGLYGAYRATSATARFIPMFASRRSVLAHEVLAQPGRPLLYQSKREIIMLSHNEFEYNFRPVHDLFAPNQDVVMAMRSDVIKEILMDSSADCSEIALVLHKASGGKGKTITIESLAGLSKDLSVGELNEVGNKVIKRYQYHTIFKDAKYVYDPKLSKEPIARGDYSKLIRKFNPDGVRIYEGDPWSPVMTERRGNWTNKMGKL